MADLVAATARFRTRNWLTRDVMRVLVEHFVAFRQILFMRAQAVSVVRQVRPVRQNAVLRLLEARLRLQMAKFSS